MTTLAACRARTRVSGIGAVACLLFASLTFGQTPQPPDLQVLSSYLSNWALNPIAGGGREIRFSTGFLNAGTGALHFYGGATHPDSTQDIWQRVFNTGGTFTDRFAGRFVYHPSHGHIHVEDWAIYRIRSRPNNQTVGATLTQTFTTSFCILDINHFNPALPGSPANSVYGGCNLTQGLSIGWNVVLGAGLEGQSINVTGLFNGDYWLEAEVDPANHFLESSDSNNVARIPITLSGMPTTGLRVLMSAPVGVVVGPVSMIDFTFNQTIDPSTFTLADVSFSTPNGPMNATSVSSISGTTAYRVSFPPQVATGNYTMVIGPNITNTAGQALDQNNNGTGGEPGDAYSNAFTIRAPRVLFHAPMGTVTDPVSGIEFTFDQAINPSTFTPADIVSFTGPSGAINVTSVTPLAGSVFRVNFPAQSAGGLYTMVIGPNINSSTSGDAMDQNGNGVTGEQTDRYTGSFTIFGACTAGPNAVGYSAACASDTLPLLVAGQAGTSNLSFSNTDDGFASVNLGTNQFKFFGTTYTGATTLFVSTNGLITFASGSSSPDNANLTTAPTQAAIAVLWDDWVIGTGNPQAMYRLYDADTNGVSDWLIVQWNNVRHYPGGSSAGTVVFRAALALNTCIRDGDILFSYPDVDTADPNSFGASATIGIKAVGSGAAAAPLQWSFNQAVIQNGQAIRFFQTHSCAPEITQQPADIVVTSGQPATFTIAASAMTSITYQWQRNGVDIVNGGAVSGATTAQLTINPTASGDHGATFACIASNCCGSAQSGSALLTVCSSERNPTITIHPAGQLVSSGQGALFSAAASSSAGPLSYRWRRNGIDLADGAAVFGAATANLTISPTTPADNSSTYACVATNACGSTVSVAARLSVFTGTAIPVISQVYAADGNAYNADFVELFNRGDSAVDLTGWSVQYAIGLPSSPNNVIPLSGSIRPGGYYLVRVSAPNADGGPLPVPDAVHPMAGVQMSVSTGRLALVSSTASVGTNYNVPAVMDLVGYGGTFAWEGAARAPTLTLITAAFRGAHGCQDTNDNGADFQLAAAMPRNSQMPVAPCSPLCTSPADLDCDCAIGVADVPLFVTRLLDPASTPPCDPTRGDMNHDGLVNGDDLQPFVNAVILP